MTRVMTRVMDYSDRVPACSEKSGGEHHARASHLEGRGGEMKGEGNRCAVRVTARVSVTSRSVRASSPMSLKTRYGAFRVRASMGQGPA